jgi:hypothetical protein
MGDRNQIDSCGRLLNNLLQLLQMTQHDRTAICFLGRCDLFMKWRVADLSEVRGMRYLSRHLRLAARLKFWNDS